MKFFELEGAVFRGDKYPSEVKNGNEWKPYTGDRARVMCFGNEITEEEANASGESDDNSVQKPDQRQAAHQEERQPG